MIAGINRGWVNVGLWSTIAKQAAAKRWNAITKKTNKNNELVVAKAPNPIAIKMPCRKSRISAPYGLGKAKGPPEGGPSVRETEAVGF